MVVCGVACSIGSRVQQVLVICWLSCARVRSHIDYRLQPSLIIACVELAIMSVHMRRFARNMLCSDVGSRLQYSPCIGYASFAIICLHMQMVSCSNSCVWVESSLSELLFRCWFAIVVVLVHIMIRGCKTFCSWVDWYLHDCLIASWFKFALIAVNLVILVCKNVRHMLNVGYTTRCPIGDYHVQYVLFNGRSLVAIMSVRMLLICSCVEVCCTGGWSNVEARLRELAFTNWRSLA